MARLFHFSRQKRRRGCALPAHDK